MSIAFGPKPENLPILQYDGRQKSGHESDTDGRHWLCPPLPAGLHRPRRHSGSVLVTTIGFKRIGLAFAALVVVGLGAIAVSSFLISTEVARDAVKAQIRAATGLDPAIRGEVRVSIFPPDTVSLRHTTMYELMYSPPPVSPPLGTKISRPPLTKWISSRTKH